jgi:VanZ family protein
LCNREVRQTKIKLPDRQGRSRLAGVANNAEMCGDTSGALGLKMVWDASFLPIAFKVAALSGEINFPTPHAAGKRRRSMNARRSLDRGNAWQLVLAGYWSALFVGTHLPSDAVDLPGDSFDKLVHMTAFTVLAGLLATAWQRSAGRLVHSHLWAAWTVIVLYGALDEWTQTFVGRQASVGDWLADAIGGAVGLIAFYLRQRRRDIRP